MNLLETDPLGMVANRPVVELQDISILTDRQDVLQRLERRSPARHSARTAVVRREGIVFAFEPSDHLRQVFQACLDVRLDPQRPECRRHHLEIPVRAGPRVEVGVATRFMQTHRTREVDIDVVLLGVLLDLILDDHDLAIDAKERGREVLNRQNALGVRLGQRSSGSR